MNLSDVEYPLRVVVESVHYCIWSNHKTSSMKPSEVKQKVAELFGDDLTEKAFDILRGMYVPANG